MRKSIFFIFTTAAKKFKITHQSNGIITPANPLFMPIIAISVQTMNKREKISNFNRNISFRRFFWSNRLIKWCENSKESEFLSQTWSEKNEYLKQKLRTEEHLILGIDSEFQTILNETITIKGIYNLRDEWIERHFRVIVNISNASEHKYESFPNGLSQTLEQCVWIEIIC